MTGTCSCGTTDGVCRSTGSACKPAPACTCAPTNPVGPHSVTCSVVGAQQPNAMVTPDGMDIFYADNPDDAYHFWQAHGALPLDWTTAPDLWVQLPGKGGEITAEPKRCYPIPCPPWVGTIPAAAAAATDHLDARAAAGDPVIPEWAEPPELGTGDYYARLADGHDERVVELMGFFGWAHLRPDLQGVKGPIADLAASMLSRVAEGEELLAGLRKLLEASDCLVRAAL